MLKRLGIDTRNLDVEKLRSEYNTLYSKKVTLQKHISLQHMNKITKTL